MRCFVEEKQIFDSFIQIQGNDVNHIKNVLRMKKNDHITINDRRGKEYYCIIDALTDEYIDAKIVEVKESQNELRTKLILFQGLPKKDKMEWIIQKAVELGVSEIVPVATKRSIVKIDEKKEARILDRWNMIAEGGAKQSGRAYIPEVKPILSFKEAVAYACRLDMNIIPYEKVQSIAETKRILKDTHKDSIGIFIGPEGGFDEEEILLATNHGIQPISLGKRILRTETAGLAILSILMFQIEEDEYVFEMFNR